MRRRAYLVDFHSVASSVYAMVRENRSFLVTKYCIAVSSSPQRADHGIWEV